MREKKVLDKLQGGELTANEAYELLYPSVDTKQLKRARFIKMKIKTDEGGRAGKVILGTLFFLPLPMMFVRLATRLALKSKAHKSGKFHTNEFMENISPEDLKFLLKYCKGTQLTIESNDADVSIKIY